MFRNSRNTRAANLEKQEASGFFKEHIRKMLILCGTVLLCIAVGKDAHHRRRLAAIHPLNDVVVAGESLGEGGQGVVEKVYLKSDRTQVYARKRISKEDLTEDQLSNISREKHIGEMIDNQFVSKILGTCEDDENTYFLMDFYRGGDFEKYKEGHTISEEHAKFYIACANEALIYLHEKDIIYRDLKPANLMIDQDGYLNLIDFGLARFLANDETCDSAVGTCDYLAPEVNYHIMDHDFAKLTCKPYNYAEGYNHAADYFALGSMLYEMLVGKVPHPNGCYDYIKERGIGKKTMWGEYEDYEYDLKVDVEFPEYIGISDEAKSLITKLLDFNPESRIGGEKIYKEEWFHGFDLGAFRARRMAAPWKPNRRISLPTKTTAMTAEAFPDLPKPSRRPMLRLNVFSGATDISSDSSQDVPDLPDEEVTQEALINRRPMARLRSE